jgi:hypothetical protein
MCDLYLCGVVYGSAYVWLDGVFSGVLAACVVVCTVSAVVSRSVFCSVGVLCAGSLRVGTRRGVK